MIQENLSSNNQHVILITTNQGVTMKKPPNQK